MEQINVDILKSGDLAKSLEVLQNFVIKVNNFFQIVSYVIDISSESNSHFSIKFPIFFSFGFEFPSTPIHSILVEYNLSRPSYGMPFFKY